MGEAGQNTQPQAGAAEARPAPSRRTWRRSLQELGILAAISYLGASLLHPHPDGLILNYLAELAGTASVPLVPAALIGLFFKGPSRILVGIAILALVYGLMLLGSSFERGAMDSISNELKRAKQEASTQIDKTGDMAVSTARLAQALTNILSQAGLLSIRDSNVLAAVVLATTPMLDCRREADRIYQQMIDPRSANWRTREDLDERIRLYRQFKNSYEKQLKICEGLDVALKTELRKRGCTPLNAQKVADATFGEETREITTGLMRCNIDSAEIGLHQLELLKSNWGAWSLESGKPAFIRQELNDEWTQTMREYFRVAERKEALGRRWALSGK